MLNKAVQCHWIWPLLRQLHRAGKTDVRLSTLLRLANIFNVDIRQLFAKE